MLDLFACIVVGVRDDGLGFGAEGGGGVEREGVVAVVGDLMANAHDAFRSVESLLNWRWIFVVLRFSCGLWQKFLCWALGGERYRNNG